MSPGGPSWISSQPATRTVALESKRKPPQKSLVLLVNACFPSPFQLLNPNYIYDGEFRHASSSFGATGLQVFRAPREPQEWVSLVLCTQAAAHLLVS